VSYPTDAAIRDAARSVAPELTGVLGAASAAVPVDAALRIEWARSKVGALATTTAARQLLGLGYVLAHRTTADLTGSQGSTSAPIGSGATAGAITSTSVGGMSIGYGAGVIGGFAAQSAETHGFQHKTFGRHQLAFHARRRRAQPVHVPAATAQQLGHRQSRKDMAAGSSRHDQSRACRHTRPPCISKRFS
jgi:hypothetical protein